KAWSHDADYEDALAVDRDGFSDRAGIAAESIAPQLVAEHRHTLRARLIVGREKIAAELGIHAEHAEELRIYARAADLPRLVSAHDGEEGIGPAADVFEHRVGLAPVVE